MVMRRNALGRGLDALIPSTPPRHDAEVAPRVTGELELREIAPNPEQPRRRFDDADLETLAESIRRHGVLQPVVVRRAPPGAAKPYELVLGERRLRAAQRAGRASIPALVQDVEPNDLLEVALVENVQRRDLDPIELAHAFRALLAAGRTQDEVGERVGLDRSTVANHLRLLELPKELQEDIELGALSMGHAKALLQLANPERRRHLRDRIVAEGLSVRVIPTIGIGETVSRSEPRTLYVPTGKAHVAREILRKI